MRVIFLAIAVGCVPLVWTLPDPLFAGVPGILCAWLALRFHRREAGVKAAGAVGGHVEAAGASVPGYNETLAQAQARIDIAVAAGEMTISEWRMRTKELNQTARWRATE